MSSPQPAPARLLPSALPHGRESPNHSSAMQSPAAYENGSYDAQDAADDLEDSSMPPIQPFFTLVEDSNTQSTLHPSVSYIFVDDDQDPITNAAIRIDESPSSRKKPQKKPPESAAVPQASPSGGRRRSVQGGVGSSGGGAAGQERCILVSLGPDGRSIVSAESLNPDWHVDNAELSLAPTLDGDTGAVGTSTSPGPLTSRLRRTSAAAEQRTEELASTPIAPDGPLMLKIRGSELPGSIGHEEALGMGIDGLCDVFRERLNELRRVVEITEQAERGA